MNEWFTLVGFVLKSIIFLVLVGTMAFLAARLLGRKYVSGSRGKYLQVVDHVAIGPGRSVCLLKVGDKFLLVGSAERGVELIWSFDEISVETEKASGGVSFSSNESYEAVMRFISTAGERIKGRLRKSRRPGDRG